MRRLVSGGSPFEAQAGYSRAVVHGDWCFIAGTTGYDYRTMTMPAGVKAQTRQAFVTIAATLSEAGFAVTDIVRATYYLADVADWPIVAPVLGELLGAVRPAATCIGAQLILPEMRIEIEVTALRQGQA